MDRNLVVLDPLPEERLARMRPFLPAGFSLTSTRSRDTADQIEGMRRAFFAITGDVPVTDSMIAAGAAAGCRGIHKWGVGVDNIDCAAAKSHGLRVLRTTGSNAVAVAESAVALILALQRSIVAGHEGMREGRWRKGALGPRTMRLAGKTVGLVGLGFIGKNVAKMLSGFDCTVLYTKPNRLEASEEAALRVRFCPFEKLIAKSDVVSLHCELTAETDKLLDAQMFAAMKEGAALINTARGGIVDEDALCDALETGRLRAAALDVFAVEPLPLTHRLRALENVILTPHIASQAVDTFGSTVERMFTNIASIAQETEPPALDVVV